MRGILTRTCHHGMPPNVPIVQNVRRGHAISIQGGSCFSRHVSNVSLLRFLKQVYGVRFRGRRNGGRRCLSRYGG